MIKSLAIFTDADRLEELTQTNGAAAGRRGRRPPSEGDDRLIEELEIGVRAYNCLKRAGVQTIGDLTSEVLLGADRDPELRRALDRGGRRGAELARPARCARSRSDTMRHRRNRHKLSRDAAHRKALLRNL